MKLAFALALLNASFACAADPTPLNLKVGEWEYTVTMKMAGMPQAPQQMPQIPPDQLAKLPPEQRAKIVEEYTREVPADYKNLIEEYFRGLNKKHGFK